jgi:hypothetical protein
MIIRDAGVMEGYSAPNVVRDAGALRKARILETARQLRGAQTDEEAADALEAALELAKE